MSNRVIERKPNGQFAKGSSGNLGGNAQRSRHALKPRKRPPGPRSHDVLGGSDDRE